MKRLIFFVGLVVALSIAAVIGIGSRSFDGVVVDKPYEHGLHWEKAQNDRLASGWSVDFTGSDFRKGTNDITMLVLDKDRKPIPGISVSVTISRPATNAYDKTYEALAVKNGIYSIKADLPLYGYWDIRADIAKDGKSVIFEKRVYAVQSDIKPQ